MLEALGVRMEGEGTGDGSFEVAREGGRGALCSGRAEGGFDLDIIA